MDTYTLSSRPRLYVKSHVNVTSKLQCVSLRRSRMPHICVFMLWTNFKWWQRNYLLQFHVSRFDENNNKQQISVWLVRRKKYRPTPSVIGIFCTNGHERSCSWGYSMAFCFSLNMFFFAFCIFLFLLKNWHKCRNVFQAIWHEISDVGPCDSFLWPISTNRFLSSHLINHPRENKQRGENHHFSQENTLSFCQVSHEKNTLTFH